MSTCRSVPQQAMRRLAQTVVQLEEAKRFILAGDVPHLRLALILLDNLHQIQLILVLSGSFGADIR